MSERVLREWISPFSGAKMRLTQYVDDNDAPRIQHLRPDGEWETVVFSEPTDPTWMPSHNEIISAIWNPDPTSVTHKSVRALINKAVERALAEREDRHQRELIAERAGELHWALAYVIDQRTYGPIAGRLETLRSKLAALKPEPSA